MLICIQVKLKQNLQAVSQHLYSTLPCAVDANHTATLATALSILQNIFKIFAHQTELIFHLHGIL